MRWHWSVRNELVREDIWREEDTQSLLLATTVYEYDPAGRLTLAHSDDAKVEFEYNAQGERVCERINGREVVHQRDEQTHLPLSRHTAAGKLAYGYDVTGRLTQLQAGDFAPLHLEYDRLGRECQRHTAAGFTQSQGYSPTGLLLEQSAGQHSTVNRRWAYDGAYNVTRIDDALWGTSHYHYNNNDQIIHAEQRGAQPALEFFNYDGDLNLTEQGSRPQVWRYRWDARIRRKHSLAV